MRRAAGFSIVEALVAAALAGVAAAVLVGVAGVAARGVARAVESATAVVLATDGLERQRAGPRASGTDVYRAPDGTTFARRWRVEGGRGTPTRLALDLAWGERTFRLATRAWP